MSSVCQRMRYERFLVHVGECVRLHLMTEEAATVCHFILRRSSTSYFYSVQPSHIQIKFLKRKHWWVTSHSCSQNAVITASVHFQLSVPAHAPPEFKNVLPSFDARVSFTILLMLHIQVSWYVSCTLASFHWENLSSPLLPGTSLNYSFMPRGRQHIISDSPPLDTVMLKGQRHSIRLQQPWGQITHCAVCRLFWSHTNPFFFQVEFEASQQVTSNLAHIELLIQKHAQKRATNCTLIYSENKKCSRLNSFSWGFDQD